VVFAGKLARSGHDLILVARRRERLVEVTEHVESQFGVAAEAHVADLADRDAVSTLESRIADDPSLTMLVNNAGLGGYKPSVSLDPESADQVAGRTEGRGKRWEA
jgi:short-subunit dehydrogenase